MGRKCSRCQQVAAANTFTGDLCAECAKVILGKTEPDHVELYRIAIREASACEGDLDRAEAAVAAATADVETAKQALDAAEANVKLAELAMLEALRKEAHK